MEPYEILEELNKTTFQSPFTELKTLSDLVAELRTYWAESQNSKRAWYLVDLWDNLLLSKLHIGLFVAANYGEPLCIEFKVPSQVGYGVVNEDYAKAQQEVIFEGWEVFNDISIEHKTTGDTIQFFRNGNVYYDKKIRKDVYESLLLNTNPSISDLAEATQSNPLKLK